MYTTGLALFALSALSAVATPITTHQTLEARDPSIFDIHVWNNCHFTKMVALYQIAPGYVMKQLSTPTNVAPGQMHMIEAPFYQTGLRVSGHAEWSVAGQWKAQALAEFGYSKYGSVDGSAYDISIMPGSDGDIGVGIYPQANGKGSLSCESKTCFPWYCPLSQGWTNQDQSQDGSPADTVCYKGKSPFKFVFCP